MTTTSIIYNYFRDGYDPAVGRYTQSDPLLRPNRFFTDEWAFYVPVMLRSSQWLHPYSYVTSQPLLESDPLGLGPWGILKCLWMGKQMIEYNEQCKGECTDDFMKQLRFMQKYDAVFLDEALLNCTCTKAAQDGKETLCAKWAATCVTSALPTPRRP
jgi:hypothetical protein